MDSRFRRLPGYRGYEVGRPRYDTQSRRASDVFECDRCKPFARIDRCGLFRLLDGGQLRALIADTALISTVGGSSLTFYRRPQEYGQVLAWELAS